VSAIHSGLLTSTIQKRFRPRKTRAVAAGPYEYVATVRRRTRFEPGPTALARTRRRSGSPATTTSGDNTTVSSTPANACHLTGPRLTISLCATNGTGCHIPAGAVQRRRRAGLQHHAEQPLPRAPRHRSADLGYRAHNGSSRAGIRRRGLCLRGGPPGLSAARRKRASSHLAIGQLRPRRRRRCRWRAGPARCVPGHTAWSCEGQGQNLVGDRYGCRGAATDPVGPVGGRAWLVFLLRTNSDEIEDCGRADREDTADSD
jgi:hypothetical protein